MILSLLLKSCDHKFHIPVHCSHIVFYFDKVLRRNNVLAMLCKDLMGANFLTLCIVCIMGGLLLVVLS
jgi:hypothetical protein